MTKKSNPLFIVRLNNLVSSLGISQERFSELCGLTPAAVSQILAGKRNPSLDTLNRIHMATGVSIDHLLGLKVVSK